MDRALFFYAQNDHFPPLKNGFPNRIVSFLGGIPYKNLP